MSSVAVFLCGRRRVDVAKACLELMLAKSDDERDVAWAARVARLTAEMTAAGMSQEAIDRRIDEFALTVMRSLNRPSAASPTGGHGPEAA